MLTSKQKIFIGLVATALWLVAIAGIHFFPDVKDYLIAFIALCTATLVGLGVTHINEQTATSSETHTAGGLSVSNSITGPAGKVLGFSAPWMLMLLATIAIGIAACTSGCTTTTASMYAGVATQAKAGIQVFDDNTLATMHDLLCAQPYSAIQRHPELQPGIVALCGPLVNTASLDPAQVASMLSIAKQLGLTATPATSGAKP